MQNSSDGAVILSIDIGGSRVKAALLNQEGQLITDYRKVDTPVPATPEKLMEAIKNLVKDFNHYENISVGFPGFVRDGVILTAPNLNTNLWRNVNLQQMLGESLQKPVRVINDADLLGLGVISGKGFEMVITLGTGFGTAFFKDGKLLPHLELAHHPVSKDQTYDEYVGEKALESKGIEKWTERMKKVMRILKTVFNYDTLFIGGGNSKKLNFPLDENMKVFSNKDGIKGGSRLWQQ